MTSSQLCLSNVGFAATTPPNILSTAFRSQTKANNKQRAHPPTTNERPIPKATTSPFKLVFGQTVISFIPSRFDIDIHRSSHNSIKATKSHPTNSDETTRYQWSCYSYFVFLLQPNIHSLQRNRNKIFDPSTNTSTKLRHNGDEIIIIFGNVVVTATTKEAAAATPPYTVNLLSLEIVLICIMYNFNTTSDSIYFERT